ncbi:oryzin precursor [Annulohypoxylon maeteangense]|uniref:oryzin precursor n=1 Tax=Annulohypoxylon maeteangense TaxID=1927788 RepID=UPI0020084ED7|nr:oryzin precursor [Annulohypoxylon maeteangense]KAI0889254.1 oryzin precursor [Annulohypoxylon maeteangense]
MKFLGALLAAPLATFAAPILEARGEAIPGKWIAVLKESATASLHSTFAGILGGTEPKHTYKIGSFHGYSISASDDAISSIANLDEVAYIEPDFKVSINSLTTQSSAPWGLARLSSRKPGSSDYKYDETAGKGTYAYIIDTGIYTEHPEFEGRASFGKNFVDGNTNDTDENGHGTHVAGTTGSMTYGVAKKTHLIAVKVLGADGSGAISQVIAGLQWAVDDAKAKDRIGKAVGNISLGALKLLSSSVNTAAAEAVKEGFFLAVAAGNGNIDASLYSPASEPTVCTVGATRSDDERAPFSNYGDLIDVFAPGVDILSTWNNGSTAIISGTSMATPHVAGLGAYLLGLEGARDPVALCDRIQELATQDVVTDSQSNHNILAYNGQ